MSGKSNIPPASPVAPRPTKKPAFRPKWRFWVGVFVAMLALAAVVPNPSSPSTTASSASAHHEYARDAIREFADENGINMDDLDQISDAEIVGYRSSGNYQTFRIKGHKSGIEEAIEWLVELKKDDKGFSVTRNKRY